MAASQTKRSAAACSSRGLRGLHSPTKRTLLASMKNSTTAESTAPDPAISSGKDWRVVSAIAFANTLYGLRLALRRIIAAHNSHGIDVSSSNSVARYSRSFNRSDAVIWDLASKKCGMNCNPERLPRRFSSQASSVGLTKIMASAGRIALMPPAKAIFQGPFSCFGA